MRNEFFTVVEDLLKTIEETQMGNVDKAAELIANSIMNGGILQAFGSGHSHAAAIEITGRAGGLIPAKCIKEPAGGAYEAVEGVGKLFMKKVEIRPEDTVVMISNSGRNPLPIEMAMRIKEVGAKLIVVTSLESSKELTSRHSSGKMLYEFADVILDNCVMKGDASIEVPGLPVKICGTSSVAAAMLLQSTILEAVKKMIALGHVPPVYMSANVDGGNEFNDKLLVEYANRLNRM